MSYRAIHKFNGKFLSEKEVHVNCISFDWLGCKSHSPLIEPVLYHECHIIASSTRANEIRRRPEKAAPKRHWPQPHENVYCFCENNRRWLSIIIWCCGYLVWNAWMSEAQAKRHRNRGSLCYNWFICLRVLLLSARKNLSSLIASSLIMFLPRAII